MTARNRLFSRAARLSIPLLAVLMAKTAHLPAAFASDAPARAFQSPPAEYRPLVITHAALLNRQDAAAWLGERRAGGSVLDAGVSPDSKNLDEQPWNNPTYLDDPAQFDKLRRLMAQMKQDGRRVWLYDVQSDLVAENYFGQIEDWCREHHVASSGHMLLEESLLFHVMFSGSMLKNWERMDLPGVDLLGASPYRTMAGWERGRFPVAEDYSCKLASSVAHLTGKRGVFTESFALANKATLRQILAVAAWQFAGGITHMSTYTIQQELSAEDYAALSDFAGRMAVLCRRGRHVADVAVLVPEASVWAAYAPPDGGRYERYFARNPQPVEIDRVFRDTCIALSNRQRDFDCLSESLLARTEVREGGLHLGGESFRTLVVPEARMLGAEAWNKLRAFLSSGGRAAFVGGLPCQRPECGDDPAFTEETRKLFAEYPDRTVHIADFGRLSELPGWIEGRVPAEVRWDGPAAVRILRRQEPSQEIVLVANPSGAAAAGRLTAPASGAASIWNPETGEIVEVGRLAKGQSAAVEVPGQSARFLVVEKEAGNRRPGGDFQAAVGALRRVGLPAL